MITGPGGLLQRAGFVNQTLESFNQHQFTAELLPLFIQHGRLEGVADLQDRVIATYLAAAVAAAENGALRDVWKRQRAWACFGVAKFEFRRGAWRDVAVTTGAPPVPVTDFRLEGDVGPKSWGFSVVAPGSDFGVSATTGYATLDDVPVDMVGFILAAAAWMYEMREIATYSTMIQHADVIPLYLLDSWTIPTYA